MARKLEIESKILQLNGGQYQALCSEYICKKRNLNNIVDLGQKTGSYKTTKGTPDAYSKTEDGKFILIACGTVEKNSIRKINDDIRDCLNEKKTGIKKDDIKEIVIFHTCTNINPGQQKSLENSVKGIKITLQDIDTLSYDLSNKYQSIANDHLNIPIDTNQISDIDTFINRYDNTYSNCPLNTNYIEKKYKSDLIKCVNENYITLVTGIPGVGKTKNVIEVCKYFESLNIYKVICVKLNGKPIYDDLKFELEKDKPFLIFIDDINYMPNLRSFIDYIKSNNINVKVIATIRDYQLDDVKRKIENYITPIVYRIGIMSDDDIKEVLEKSCGVTNRNWQQQIINIANGNPRIAIMTFNFLKENPNINCIADVFRKYYDNIIKSKQLTYDEVDLLFYISVLSPFSIKDEKIMTILTAKNINVLETILKLNDYELINYFNDEAIKICDQNLSNYIVYKYLFVDKKIKLSNFIKMLYQSYKLKLISTINMLTEVFYSKELYEYLCSEINVVWNESEYINNFDFLKAFHNMNLTRSSAVVKKIIDNKRTKDVPCTIKYKDNPYISDELLYIITDLNNWNFKISVQLMFKYLEKSPDLYNDIISLIKEKWIFKYLDKSFENEKYLIDYIINKYNEDTIYKDLYTLIAKKILEECFKVEIDRSYANKPGSLVFVNFSLEENKYFNDFRKYIFDKIISLSKKDNEFFNVLLEKQIWYVKKDNLNIFKRDIKYIDNELFTNIEKFDINYCVIIYNIRFYCNKYNITLPLNMQKYSLCKEFVLLDMFYSYEYGKENKMFIEYIKTLSIKDYDNLFKYLKCAEATGMLNDYKFYHSVIMMFDYLVDNKNDTFMTIFELYLNNDTPFMQQFYYLLRYNNKRELIEKVRISNSKYKYYILAFLFQQNVKVEYMDYVNNFLLDQEGVSQKYTLDVGSILKYTNYDASLLNCYTKQILLENDEQLVYQYFKNLDDELCKKLIASFEDKKILEDLYIIVLKNQFLDIKRTFGYLLVKNNPNFIIEIEKSDCFGSETLSEIMELVWKDEDYITLTTDIFNSLMSTMMGYLKVSCLVNKESDLKDMRMNWYKYYIKNNINDLNKIEWIFYVIACENDETKLEIISNFLDLNHDIEAFKKLSFFPLSYTISGSSVPYYEKQLEFLYKVDNLVNSKEKIEYLNHLDYLGLRINGLKSWIKKIKTEEFLDDYRI